MSPPPPDALFDFDGEHYLPAPITRGPWDPEAQHGGAPAALLARAVERAEAPGPMRVARVTYEFLRPVPLTPLALRARVIRPGRRVQLVEAGLWADEREVMRVTGLRVRRAEEPIAPAPAFDAPPAPPDGDGVVSRPLPDQAAESFGAGAVEHRFVAGDWSVGPATVWQRLLIPVIAGEEPSPLQRAAVSADFGNGVAAGVSWDTHTFVNADLTITLEREPRGEWICLDARTRVSPDGIGVAESVLHDLDGRIGRAAQVLYVALR